MTSLKRTYNARRSRISTDILRREQASVLKVLTEQAQFSIWRCVDEGKPNQFNRALRAAPEIPGGPRSDHRYPPKAVPTRGRMIQFTTGDLLTADV